MKSLMSSALVALGAGVFAAPLATHAQDYPAKPIRFIVGPGPDVLARMIGQKLTDSWGQQVVVDQRPGAGGIIAADTVAKSLPDGYTLLLTTGAYTINATLYPKLPFNFEHDFAPVSLLTVISFLVIVQSVGAGEIDAGTDPAGEGQTRIAQLRAFRAGHDRAPRLRNAQDQRAYRHRVGPV